MATARQENDKWDWQAGRTNRKRNLEKRGAKEERGEERDTPRVRSQQMPDRHEKHSTQKEER